MKNILIVLAFAALLISAPARADDLGYPSFRRAAPATLAVSQIVIRNDANHIASGRLIDRGRMTGDDVERYLKARLKPSGSGPVLTIIIRKAEVLNQGRTDLGNMREYIEIALDLALLSPDGLTARKRSFVEAKRSTTGAGSRLGNLPASSQNDDMEEVMRILDQRLLSALKHEFGVLQ